MNIFGKKLFGTDLFNFKKPAGQMYDFAQHGITGARNRAYDNGPGLIENWTTATAALTASELKKLQKKSKKTKTEEPKPLLSPKEIYKAGGLNAKDFAIKIDPAYIAEQVKIIDDKLAFLGPKPKEKKSRRGELTIPVSADEYGYTAYGRQELEGIREKLLNREKINEVKEVVNKYPHTTTQLISDLLTRERHLVCQTSGGFIPDWPKDAINAMKEYNDMCIKICGKKTNFYVIAKHEDFEQISRKRDPILLAQSPFGNFWQVLGAWEDEMVFLGDL